MSIKMSTSQLTQILMYGKNLLLLLNYWIKKTNSSQVHKKSKPQGGTNKRCWRLALHRWFSTKSFMFLFPLTNWIKLWSRRRKSPKKVFCDSQVSHNLYQWWWIWLFSFRRVIRHKVEKNLYSQAGLERIKTEIKSSAWWFVLQVVYTYC